MSRISRRTMILQSAATLALAGCHSKSGSGPAAAGGEHFKIGLVYFGPDEGADLCMKGLFDGFKEWGLEKGKNLEVLSTHAQGEIANIPMLLQNYISQNVDLIMTLTTPCLTAACNIAKDKNVVFVYCYDPVAAGAGSSFTQHLPNVTGVGSFPPVEATVAMIKKLIPNVKSVGTVYNTSEANSVKVISVAREAFKKVGIKLEEVPATNTSEVFQSTQVACNRNVQAMWVTGDNTALQSFDGIVKATQDAHMPLFINDPEYTSRGALACVGLGWYDPGHAAAGVAARVLRGASPATIPFQNIAQEKVVLNHDVAAKFKITFTPEMLKAAQS